MCASRSKVSGVQRRVLGYVLRVAEHIVYSARSRRVSVKLKTLVKYGYAAYGTLDFRRIRGSRPELECRGAWRTSTSTGGWKRSSQGAST